MNFSEYTKESARGIGLIFVAMLIFGGIAIIMECVYGSNLTDTTTTPMKIAIFCLVFFAKAAGWICGIWSERFGKKEATGHV